MARYRVGDGTGASLVDVARSCVQDSNQALYVALQQIEDEIEANPDIQTWLTRPSPRSPNKTLSSAPAIGGRSESQTRYRWGAFVPDWKKNADTLTGIAPPSPSSSKNGSSNAVFMVTRALISWRTMLPDAPTMKWPNCCLNMTPSYGLSAPTKWAAPMLISFPTPPTTFIGNLQDRNA